MLEAFIGIMIPFIGTTMGSMMVYLIRGKISDKINKFLLGFASGVMIAASVWSLLIPSIEMTTYGDSFKWVPAAVGFGLGILFLLLLDTLIPHLHMNAEEPEGMHTKKTSKSTMLVLAVTLHNIPEGMAVGVVFAGLLSGSTDITLVGAFVLAVGIAIQNFPEGAIVSMPLLAEKKSKHKAFLYGSASGIVEPIAAGLTILLTPIILPILPYLLAFAAGAMIYVVVEELIPECQNGKHSNIGVIGVALGFILMMVLDVALG